MVLTRINVRVINSYVRTIMDLLWCVLTMRVITVQSTRMTRDTHGERKEKGTWREEKKNQYRRQTKRVSWKLNAGTRAGVELRCSMFSCKDSIFMLDDGQNMRFV